MSALISDVIDGKVSASSANAVANISGKQLKAVEMSYKYGIPNRNGGRSLNLIDDED